MKRAIVTLALISLIFLALVSQGSPVVQPGDEIVASTHPSLSINMPDGTYINLSMVQLVLKSSQGIYLSEFNTNNWSIDKISNRSISYNANLTLVQGKAPSIMQFLSAYDGNQPSQSPNSYNAKVSVLVGPSAKSLSIHNFSIGTTPTSSEYNISKNSTVEIYITITFMEPISGSGEVFFIQSMSTKNVQDFSYEDFNGTGALGTNHGDSGVAVNSNVTQSGLSYLYWWSNSYEENGTNKSLSTSVFNYEGADYVVFGYNYTNGLSKIVQDPFITVPGTNIFKNPIIEQKITNITNFLIQHIEFFSGGLVVGIGLLGYSYSVYRKKRI